jgi:hypothetical protein
MSVQILLHQALYDKIKVSIQLFWLGNVENYPKKIGVRGWRKIARDRDTWKLILNKAKVLHGLQNQWRRGDTIVLVLWLGSICRMMKLSEIWQVKKL